MNAPQLAEGYSLIKVDYPSYINQIGALRIRAWRDEPGIDLRFFSQGEWIEQIDEDAHHWVIVKDDQVVAAARISFHSLIDETPYSVLLAEPFRSQFTHKSIASINRLVVDPSFRGRGLAKVLDAVRIELALEKGIDVIVAQPQLSRLKTLTNLGFSFVCELKSTPEMPERPLFFMLLDLK